MTKAQITSILGDLEYSLNMDLEMPEVSSIILSLDHMVYPDEHSVFRFDTSDSANLLLIYNGKKDSNYQFIKDDSIPKYIIPFEKIFGFNLTSSTRAKKPYSFGRSL